MPIAIPLHVLQDHDKQYGGVNVCGTDERITNDLAIETTKTTVRCNQSCLSNPIINRMMSLRQRTAHTHTHTRGRTVKPELLPLPLLLVDAVLLRQLPQPSTEAPAPPAAVIPGPTPFIVAAADCLRRFTPAVADAAAAAESSADQSPV